MVKEYELEFFVVFVMIYFILFVLILISLGRFVFMFLLFIVKMIENELIVIFGLFVIKELLV